MAGGPTTVALAQAVSGVGGFPFLAGGYKSVEALATEIAVLRASGGDFGVNLFVPSPDMVDAEAFSIYAAKLQSEALPYGLRLDPLPVMGDDDGWPDKLALLLNDPVPVVSFTFGLPAVRTLPRSDVLEAGCWQVSPCLRRRRQRWRRVLMDWLCRAPMLEGTARRMILGVHSPH